jgi:hypothetical protein
MIWPPSVITIEKNISKLALKIDFESPIRGVEVMLCKKRIYRRIVVL